MTRQVNLLPWIVGRLAATAVVSIVALAAVNCGSSTPVTPAPIVVPSPDPGPRTPPAPVPVLGITRVLAFGDSMTAGTTSAPLLSAFRLLDAGLSVSYPFKLQALASIRYTDQTIVVLNGGVAGKQATDDRSRFDGALSEAKPDVVLLMEGANDLNSPTASATATVNAMEDMVRDAQMRGIFVMLATLPPQRPPTSKTTTPALLTRYNNDLRTMAGNKGAQLIDLNALFPLALIGQDGLHPTEAGYDKLAEIFLDAIKAKYEKSPLR